MNIKGIVREIEKEILSEKIRMTLLFDSCNLVTIIKNSKSPNFQGFIELIIKLWLQGWFEKRGIEYSPNPNTQMPPDFFLDKSDETKNLLEVKAFNRNASPGFDIADFRMYSEEIIEKPYMLDVDYLIFGYEMGDDGVVTIKDVWLKKVWEITRPMEEWSINLQVKQGQVHKIRPGVWYSKKPRDFYMFESLEDFISAVEQAVFQNPKTHESAGIWRSKFLKSYQKFYGEKLDVPRWFDIESKYKVKKEK